MNMNSADIQALCLFSEKALLVLLDVCIKSIVVFVTALAATFLLRKSSAAHRHYVWLSAIIICATMPIVSLILPGHYVGRPTQDVSIGAVRPMISAGIPTDVMPVPVIQPMPLTARTSCSKQRRHACGYTDEPGFARYSTAKQALSSPC